MDLLELIDVDGNKYKTKKIGNQIWTTENFKATKYANKNPIALVADGSVWEALTTPAYCWYDNNIKNKDKFGALYNWHVVDTKNLAPEGWHIPTDVEWNTMRDFLIANNNNWDNTTTGNKIAKAMASTTDWNTTSDTGTIGCDLSKNNSSGFNALPAGYRRNLGYYENLGGGAFWWCNTQNNKIIAYNNHLYFGREQLFTDKNLKSCGFSVRLVKD